MRVQEKKKISERFRLNSEKHTEQYTSLRYCQCNISILRLNISILSPHAVALFINCS